MRVLGDDVAAAGDHPTIVRIVKEQVVSAEELPAALSLQPGSEVQNLGNDITAGKGDGTGVAAAYAYKIVDQGVKGNATAGAGVHQHAGSVVGDQVTGHQHVVGLVGDTHRGIIGAAARPREAEAAYLRLDSARKGNHAAAAIAGDGALFGAAAHQLDAAGQDHVLVIRAGAHAHGILHRRRAGAGQRSQCAAGRIHRVLNRAKGVRAPGQPVVIAGGAVALAGVEGRLLGFHVADIHPAAGAR